ncbi:MAG: LysR family transcriptional regulator [Lysinibacillus sp.]|nr:LysR family transcriptional regulator [Lysinibacillus sp.]
MIGNLDLYRIFNVVSGNKSFSKAAQELYMTQSAVSQAIMKLENELGVQLFHRTSKGIVLTNEGKLLNEYINSALGMINAGEEKILEINKLNTGQLRIAVGDTISRYFLLPYLEDFHARYPGIRLNILNGTTSEICDYIKSGKADVGICNLPINDENLEIIPCMEVSDIFVCGDKFKRITEKPISFEYLMKMPLIFLERKSNSRKFVENFFKKKGFQLSPAFELGSHDLVVEFAKINLGISCVVKEFVNNYLERGELYELKLEEEIPKRSIGICHLKNVPLSRAAGKFVEKIHKI